jgi:hypothetical protein
MYIAGALKVLRLNFLGNSFFWFSLREGEENQQISRALGE